MPENSAYTYQLCSFNLVENGFDATFYLPLKTEAEANLWRSDFQKLTKETFRIYKTHEHCAQRLVFKVAMFVYIMFCFS